jgi:hypothetical protein
MPTKADVGGNVPYYEITCPCGKNAVVGSYDEEEAVHTWNIINEGSGE